MAYPRYQAARAFKFIRQTSNITLTGTSWANMPTIGTLTLAAQVGDVIEAQFGAYHGGVSGGRMDAVTEVASSPVTAFSTGAAAPTSTTGDGVASWFIEGASDDSKVGGSAFLTLTAPDISAGTVTVRMRSRIPAGSVTLDVSGGTIFFAVKNLGPADPN